MKKQNLKLLAAETMKKALDNVLYTDANTTACFFIYQPKAPTSLAKFRREKSGNSNK